MFSRPLTSLRTVQTGLRTAPNMRPRTIYTLPNNNPQDRYQVVFGNSLRMYSESTILQDSKNSNNNNKNSDNNNKNSDKNDNKNSDSNNNKEKKAEKDVKELVGKLDDLDSYRPLFRLLVRSQDFRNSLTSYLGLLKKVVNRQLKEAGVKPGDSLTDKVVKPAENIGKKIAEGEDVNPFTDEEWKEISDELDTLFQKLTGQKDIEGSLRQVFALGSALVNNAEKKVKDTVDQNQDKIQEAKETAVNLAEKVVGAEPLDKFSKSAEAFYSKVKEDKEVQKWIKDVQDEVLSLSKGYKGEKDLDKLRKLFSNAASIFQRYKSELSEYVDSASSLVNELANDDLVVMIRQNLNTLSDKLTWEDAKGDIHFAQEAGASIASTISSVIREKCKELKVPRIEKRDGNTSYTFDNITVSATWPDKIKLHTERHVSIDTNASQKVDRDTIESEVYMNATIKGITARLPNVNFTYDGMAISESGVVTVSIPEPGATLTVYFVMKPSKNVSRSHTAPGEIAGDSQGVELTTDSKMNYEFVRVEPHIDLPDLILDFDESTLSHKYLVPIGAKLGKTIIRTQVEEAIENQLSEALLTVGKKVTDIVNQIPNLSISDALKSLSK